MSVTTVSNEKFCICRRFFRWRNHAIFFLRRFLIGPWICKTFSFHLTSIFELNQFLHYGLDFLRRRQIRELYTSRECLDWKVINFVPGIGNFRVEKFQRANNEDSSCWSSSCFSDTVSLISSTKIAIETIEELRVKRRTSLCSCVGILRDLKFPNCSCYGHISTFKTVFFDKRNWFFLKVSI